MAEESQPTVENAKSATGNGNLGSSNAASLNSIFSTSPIHSSDLTAASVKADYVANVLNATVKGGYGFAADVSMNYDGAPDYDFSHDGGASPFVPNPSSPGEGSVNPSDKPDAPDNFKDPSASEGTYGGGTATGPADVSPADASESLRASRIDGLTKGKSPFSE